ncbi:histidine phosphatase family protein [Enterococcus sp. LJL128]|uniref:histidine phosphatase family protein n=1 Tax=Enterococcus sp. LJL51 TaxID=3416656 RepID=UPI003CE998A6
MLYLIRQGETEWNALKRFNGRTETELNQKGVAQAREQAEKLRDVAFDCCFCSPQKRARQAGEIICGDKLIFDERLMEIDCGEFEGTEETSERLKQFWQAVMTGKQKTENYKDFMQRNSEFCTMIMEKYREQTVLVVTHAANARVINYYFSGQPKNYDFKTGVARSGEILVFDY